MRESHRIIVHQKVCYSIIVTILFQVKSWGVKDVIQWLENKQLDKFIPLFNGKKSISKVAQCCLATSNIYC